VTPQRLPWPTLWRALSALLLSVVLWVYVHARV
jgi:hypothetical protein